MRSASLVVMLSMLALVHGVATAQEATPPRTEAEVERIGSRLDGELMSPFCHGLTLDDCPTSGAAELRAEIRDWLREGRSEEWIREALVDRYGEGILGAPRFRGLGIVAWVLPGVVLLTAIAGLVLWMRGHVEPEPQRRPGGPADDEGTRAAAARVDSELQRLDEI